MVRRRVVISHNRVRLLDHHDLGVHADAEQHRDTAPESPPVSHFQSEAVFIRSELLEAGREEEHSLPSAHLQNLVHVEHGVHAARQALPPIDRERHPALGLQRAANGARELEAHKVGGGERRMPKQPLHLGN